MVGDGDEESTQAEVIEELTVLLEEVMESVWGDNIEQPDLTGCNVSAMFFFLNHVCVILRFGLYPLYEYHVIDSRGEDIIVQGTDGSMLSFGGTCSCW